MQRTQTNTWDESKILRYKKETGQALLCDEQTLVSYCHDFGRLIQSSPSAVCIPNHIDSVTSLILFANQHHLSLAIRGNGLSQGGQSLPMPGGLTLSMQHFSQILDTEQDSIWVEANCSWAQVLDVSLKQSKAPFVLPYNCNLSVGGVLSAGGVGAGSFKRGTINAYVGALEVIDGTGTTQIVDKTSPLFHACLSGQGRCAVITKAKINLRPVKSKVSTFFLVYTSQEQWFTDLEAVKSKVDYVEMFCSPAVQGTQLKGDRRVPLAQWLYGMHLSVEHDGIAPKLHDISVDLKPWNVLHSQEESVTSYFLRHNSRFEMMKMLGQWDLLHPWYECYVPTTVLKKHLAQLLANFPIHYANFVHVVPIAKQKAALLMFPEEDSICSLMILNPGVPDVLKDSCLQVIAELDEFLIAQGGKRYLSGYMGEGLSESYWANHFSDQYGLWVGAKKEFDPNGVFSSVLHPSIYS